jgi:polysaccharide biosynthesis/export protein
MQRVSVFHVWLALTAGLLGACTIMPTSGPSKGEVQSASDHGIPIVDVDATVAKRLLEGRPHRLFSDVIPKVSRSSELVGPGDVLEVAVWEAPPAVLFTKDSALATTTVSTSSGVTTFPQQMVGSEGFIYIPFAGKVMASGYSLDDIQSSVTRQLQNKANQPQVMVRLVTNNTAYVTVVGEVARSTRMPLTPRGERLLDALAAAGGASQPIQKVTLQVTRDANVSALPLETIIRDPRQNIPLQAGDVVTALYQSYSFTALGATGKRDEINFESQGISLAQALARVGGVIDDRSDASGVFIFRFESRTKQEVAGTAMTSEATSPIIYRINLKDPRTFFVAQNFPIENRDVLYVANSTGAEIQKFLNLLLSTVYPIQGAISLTK